MSSCICACPMAVTHTSQTATCMNSPRSSSTDQAVVDKPSSSKANTEHSTETVTKTVMLTSMLPYLPCKSLSTLSVKALPSSGEDVGNVPASEHTISCACSLILFCMKKTCYH